MSTSAFNNYSTDYDAHFTFSPIGILQRKRVFKFLFPFLKKEKKVLEINCGTGHDALQIAPHVKEVHATDLSPGMISEANKKKSIAGSNNVLFECSDIRNVHEHLGTRYDLLFSNFGGLNCLPREDIRKFSENIAPFIENEGHLVLVIMGKKCARENFFFYTQNDRRIYRRDTHDGLETQINGPGFKTYYYSPIEMKKLFSDFFRVVEIKPIGLFIPPSYLNAYFLDKKILLSGLNFLEKNFAGSSRLANYSDHYLITFKKKSVGQ
jgi:ubiquinone/menaquinone biosynthesis C-methylase UbiE